MFDNNSETAWSEGAEGDGIGEYTLARIDITKPIKIWNGFGKSNELFLKNNRIKDATVYVLLSKCESPAVNAKVFSNFVFLDKFNLVFKDINEFQEFKIPDSILDSYAKIKNKVPDKQNCSFGNFYTPFIAIQIDSVYKGSMYSDTLITEIKN